MTFAKRLTRYKHITEHNPQAAVNLSSEMTFLLNSIKGYPFQQLEKMYRSTGGTESMLIWSRAHGRSPGYFRRACGLTAMSLPTIFFDS